MAANNIITLDQYSEDANKQFDEMQKRLNGIESSFSTMINGKTTKSLIASIAGSAIWLIAFIIAAVYVRYDVHGALLIVTMLIITGLIAAMIADIVMDYSYYERLETYKNAVALLKNRVDIGKASIRSNHERFVKSKVQGWNCHLDKGESIPAETDSIETTVHSMELLKHGLVNRAKTVLYFAAAIAVTFAGGFALSWYGKSIIEGISGGYFSDETLSTLSLIGMIIAGGGEVILAKYAWGLTDCNVTNITLFAIAIAPLAYLLVIFAATLIVTLVVWLLKILLYVAIIGIIIAVLAAFSSGG